MGPDGSRLVLPRASVTTCESIGDLWAVSRSENTILINI